MSPFYFTESLVCNHAHDILIRPLIVKERPQFPLDLSLSRNAFPRPSPVHLSGATSTLEVLREYLIVNMPLN